MTHHLLDNNKPTIQRFSKADQDLITSTFEQIRSRHASTVENLADVVIGLRKIQGLDGYDNSNKNRSSSSSSSSIIEKDLLESFLQERLGIQLLCDHYVSLSKQIKQVKKRQEEVNNDMLLASLTGGIRIDCNFIDVLNDAILEAKHVCDANLGIAPEVYVVLGNQSCKNKTHNDERVTIRSGMIEDDDDESMNITLIRPWIHHVLVEVLKNAMSSNVEKFINSHPSSSSSSSMTSTKVTLPPSIYVRVKNSDSFLICEVLDQGVGIDTDTSESKCSDNSDNTFEKSFEFAFSSSSERWDRLDEQQSYAMVRSPLGSLGVGLTLSRLMMRMFGGDLMLCNRPSRLVLQEETHGSKAHVLIESGCTATIKLSRDPTIKEWTLFTK